MTKRAKSRITTMLKILLAAGLIYIMVRSGALDPSRLWRLMTFQNIMIALGLTALNLLFGVWRWILILRARGIHISMRYGFSLYLIGMLFNYALPGAVGGDVVRGYYLVADHPERKMDAALSVLIDRVLGLYSFFMISLSAVIFEYPFVMSHEKIRWVFFISLTIFIAMTVGFIVSFSNRLQRRSGLKTFLGWSERFKPLHEFFEAFQRFGENRVMIFNAMMAGVMAQMCSMAFFFELGRMMNESGITWKAVLFAVPMGFVVTAVPISPAGIGVGQVAFHYLFRTYLNHPTQFGPISITAFQMTMAVWAVAGSYFYIRRSRPPELVEATT